MIEILLGFGLMAAFASYPLIGIFVGILEKGEIPVDSIPRWSNMD